MHIVDVDLVFLSQRVLVAFTEYVDHKKSEVANGKQTADLAAHDVQIYGHGLAKALALAEELAGAPSAGMAAHVERRVREFEPRIVESR